MLPNTVNFSTKLVCPNPFPFLCRSHLLQATSGILYFCGCVWPCEERVVFLKERRGRSLLNFFGRKPLLVRNNKLHHPGAYSHTGCCATEITGFLILLSVPRQNEDYVNMFRWASHLIGWNVCSDALDQKCTWTIRIPPLYLLRLSSLSPFHYN